MKDLAIDRAVSVASSISCQTLVILAALVQSAPAQSAVKTSDWPTYMHDNSRAGGTAAKVKLPLSQRWTISSARPPKRAWPGPGGKVIEKLHLVHRVRFDDVFHVAIVGKRVFYGSSVDNRICCIDLKDGTEIWSFVTGAPVRLAPTVFNDRVFIGSDDGFAYCLDAAGGKLIWKVRAGPADERILARGRMVSRWPVRTGVLIDDGIAYFGAGTFPHETVFLYAVNAKDGKVLWCNDEISQRDAGRNDLTPQGYLLATDNLLFVPSGRTFPAAINKKTGKLVHKQKSGGKQVGGSQALLAGDKILSVGEHHILALNQKKGDIISKLSGKQMTLVGDLAYIAADGEILAVDRKRYVEANRPKDPRAKSAAALRKTLVEHAYLKHLKSYQSAQRKKQTSKKKLKELRKKIEDKRTADFEKKAELAELVGILWRAPCRHESTLILAGETLVVGGEGEVVALDASTGKRQWNSSVDGDARGLAAVDGHLVVSTTAGKIYAFADAKQKRTVSSPSRPASTTPFPGDESVDRYRKSAAEILERSGVTRGFCLVLGGDQGRLAYELARQSDLMIFCAEPDPTKVRAARRALVPTGLYGNRITVDHLDLSVLPYPSYFANLVVCDGGVPGGAVQGDPVQVARCVKPHGGVICLPWSSTLSATDVNHAAWLNKTGLEAQGGVVAKEDGWITLQRVALPGAASWTHQYGNPGASSSIADQRVRNGLSVLWYGDPGPSAMLNRHQGAASPLASSGRLFVQGDETVQAYDAYNGLKLWERANPGAVRTGVFRNFEPGNLVADAVSLFVVVGDHCLRLDGATGKLLHTYVIPDPDAKSGRTWGYVSVHAGRLFGTSTLRKLIPEASRRRGQPASKVATDKLFAFDIESGRRLWEHAGKSISHNAIAVAGSRVYFIDSTLTTEQRQQLLQQDKSELASLTGAARKLAEDRIKRMDARLAAAVDVKTGKRVWTQPIDVTDCTNVGIGAGELTLMVQEEHIVLGGANANGHYWNQFLKGDFKRRRLVVLAADDGHKVWARDANYRHRPIILGREIIAEPWSFDLETGIQRTRIHPLTGEASPWMFARPGHHCGAIAATPGMLLFRSKFTAYYDLGADSGTRHFAGHRLGCWINAIPADGLVLVPEASAGCACLFSLTSTIVFEPRRERQVWGVYGASGAATPIRHMALNLGGPGDRRDSHGKLWLGYPRPSSRRGIDLPLKLGEKFTDKGEFYAHNSNSVSLSDEAGSWIYASGASGLMRCTLALISEEEDPATYTVKLYFVSSDRQGRKPRVFDIRLQEATVLKALDLQAAAGGPNKTVVKEFSNVAVSKGLKIELVPRTRQPASRQAPRLCGIEVLRTGSKEILQQR
ncbi:MAG: PQQ-binding-like beta-propeller repeat protein [Planctomycetota bacterium]|nr:PQQ-binding-like beta-propeller repeat protein [Planctomycetota bacterium]